MRCGRLMYEKRHVDDETMRKIVAWVGNEDNKADMRRPVWLEASIKERGLESFAPGYVTRLEACWLAYWYDRFELFKVLYDELVNHAPQYRRADAELLFMMVLTRPNMQAMNNFDADRNIVFEGVSKTRRKSDVSRGEVCTTYEDRPAHQISGLVARTNALGTSRLSSGDSW